MNSWGRGRDVSFLYFNVAFTYIAGEGGGMFLSCNLTVSVYIYAICLYEVVFSKDQ